MKRLGLAEALRVAKEILCSQERRVVFTKHARKEMAEDFITEVDVVNVIRGGNIYQQPDLENGSYRYRIETGMFVVVVAFRSMDEIVVVTAWRKK